VESAGENVDRAKIAVVGGVGNQLVVQGQGQLLGQRVGIICLEDALAPVVELAVADQDAETGGGGVIAEIAGGPSTDVSAQIILEAKRGAAKSVIRGVTSIKEQTQWCEQSGDGEENQQTG